MYDIDGGFSFLSEGWNDVWFGRYSRGANFLLTPKLQQPAMPGDRGGSCYITEVCRSLGKIVRKGGNVAGL